MRRWRGRVSQGGTAKHKARGKRIDILSDLVLDLGPDTPTDEHFCDIKASVQAGMV